VSETKFTPGPWEVKTMGHQTLGVEWISSPHGDKIADCAQLSKYDAGLRCFCIRPELDEISANARLIAAAPDLLKALQSFVEMYVVFGNCGDCGNWDPETEKEVIAARAAIAKATGEAP